MADCSYLSETENKQRNRIIEELNNAYNQRQETWIEFDDMTYDQWYVQNKKAAAGYIRPKKNRQDIRTVTGVTREKCNTVTAALLKYNFNFTITPFDENDWPNRDLGFGLESLVRKSRKLEDPTHDEKRALYYSEFVSQGNLFIYEQNVEEEIVHKEIEKEFSDVLKAKWEVETEFVRRAQTEMVPGINVYLGNMREFYMNKQPYIGLRREIHKAEAESLYGQFKRWEYVKMGITHVLNDQGGQEYNIWQMDKAQKDYLEEIRYFNIFTNELQIMLNGVPMLPEGFPMTYELGARSYPIVKWNGEPISRNFAYCRGISAKNKFNQSMIDEMFRIIILKFRKSTTPAMANMTGKMLNKSIFDPGTIHQGVDPDKLKPIGDMQAVTGPEFDTFKLVKQAIDESSVSPILEGNRTPGEQTAKEITELKIQSLSKLGMIMMGAIQGEEQMVWLRTYNILRNWTKPVEVKIDKYRGEIKKFRSESIETDFDDGESGLHQVEMTDEMPSPEQVMAEEDLVSEKKGILVRKTYLDAETLSKLKFKFQVKVTPVEKESSELKAAIFEESMLKAMQMFPDAINKPYVQSEWAKNQRLDPRKLFIQQAPPQPQIEGMPPGMGGPQEMPMSPSGVPSGAKTVGAQALPQISQQNKPSLKRML